MKLLFFFCCRLFYICFSQSWHEGQRSLVFRRQRCVFALYNHQLRWFLFLFTPRCYCLLSRFLNSPVYKFSLPAFLLSTLRYLLAMLLTLYYLCLLCLEFCICNFPFSYTFLLWFTALCSSGDCDYMYTKFFILLTWYYLRPLYLVFRICNFLFFFHLSTLAQCPSLLC